MPPNILIIIGIAAIFALFLSDSKTESEVKKNESRMVSHVRNRVSSGIDSRLGKRRAKRNGTSLKVSHFIEEDDDDDINDDIEEIKPVGPEGTPTKEENA